jgi:ATP-binding cassette subfamily F protein 3
LRLEGAAVGYEPGCPVLEGLNLRIDNDDRIALLGQNGNGKSTFAKLLAGRLEPLTGSVFGVKRVKVGYFAQHQLDELDPHKAPYDYIVELIPEATEAQKRSRLGAYGFGSDKADTKCGHLSGGEKARLLLMLTAFDGPHLLILDEPTNHLDVDSREALVHALNEFDGAVILVSHDRHLVEATADRLWIVGQGTVRPYDGDMESYRQLLLTERGGRARERGRENGGGANAGPSRADQRRAAAERRAEVAPFKQKIQAAEREMERLIALLAKLDAALSDPELYASASERAQKLSIERARVAKRLREVEDAWLAATEAYEAATRAAEST